MKEKSLINFPEEWASDDLELANRLRQDKRSERGPVMSVLFEAKDIALGGLNGLRQHPTESLEIAAAGVAAGLAAALAGRHHRPRPAH